jgi:hypothetical protein
MAILALGGPTKVEISSSGGVGLTEIPAVLSTDLSYDNASVTMADGRQIKAGTTVTLTVETLDLLETGGWFAVTETMLNTPFAATPSDYQAKITMKDGTKNFVIDTLNCTGRDLIPGADGEYSRYVLTFVGTAVNNDDIVDYSPT